MSNSKQPIADRHSAKRLWSKQEDELLCEIVSQHCDLKWAVISEQFNQRVKANGAQALSRTNKQCRERWQNHLNPQLKNSAEWSQAQHEQLFALFRQHSHQWCRISLLLEEAGFNRRGDNHIKNYFYSSIKRAIKRINEVVRESNRAIKKQKSILYHYNQKYAYKKRLSLERQILNPTNGANSESTSNENGQMNTEPIDQNMRIIKELDQDIVSKILLIAEQRGAKKFNISNKYYEGEAVHTRNRLIDYINNADGFTQQDIIKLTTEILELSRKCKRKNSKFNPPEEEVSEEIQEEPISSEEKHESPDKISLHSQNNLQQWQEVVQKKEKEAENIPLLPKTPSPALSELDSKKQLVPVESERKGPVDKNLLERFLCDQGDQRALNQMQKRLCGSEQLSSRLQEGQGSISGYFFFGQEPRVLLDQSNSYFYGSGCLSNRDNQPFLYDPAAIPSLAYAEGFRSVRKEEESHTNLADFNFISSMKEVQPRLTTPAGMFDFDFTPVPGNNPFAQGLFRSDSEQDRLFSSQAQLLQRASSHRSNHSRSRPAELFEQQGQGLDLLQSQQLLNRSWAYSSSRLEQGRQLCSSNNYEASRKNEFTVDLKNSNFYPFSKQ